MTVESRSIRLNTKGHCDIVDITSTVAKQVADSAVKDGTVTIFVTGSTAGVTTIEYEPGLVADLEEMWARLVPDKVSYHHDRAWGDGNGYAHVRAALLGPSLVIPLVSKRMALGTWQQIVLLDFDNRARSREVVVQIMGE
ncbi:MAG: YjbQ family protein [Chloroflexi bacterium]|nr:YjbQ family protein [Chloroflexota bacterium]MBM3172926.1 YjbQ family protein [Chloroflexota bacterium]MBM3174531.1 YjbQ family protein [Chloroflexota bacterium]MBM4449408.1 YjbQ family protein [Chloroflexota bacterium]